MALKLAGLILAGGEGRRMGGVQKGLLDYRGRPFAAHLVGLLKPHVEAVVISANQSQESYRALADIVVGDRVYAGQGPLAGLVAGLHWARGEGLDGVVMVPCDTPGLSPVWVTRLLQQIGPGRAPLFSRVHGDIHPLHGYLPVGLAEDLERRLTAGKLRIKDLLDLPGAECMDCDDLADGFINVNRPSDRDQLSP